MSNVYDSIISNVNTFSDIDINPEQIRECIKNENIKVINLFVLGPNGTNIYLAAQKWAKVNKVEHKVVYTMCESPEEAVISAKKVKEEGVLPIFVLCAVYNKLYDLYFSNTDCVFFMDHIYMKLDEMQLATDIIQKRQKYEIFSHPSPSRLVSDISCIDLTYSNSNSFAAKMCKNKGGTLCITTESSRRIYDLTQIHSFGSPLMIFTFGTTRFGIDLLESCY